MGGRRATAVRKNAGAAWVMVVMSAIAKDPRPAAVRPHTHAKGRHRRCLQQRGSGGASQETRRR